MLNSAYFSVVCKPVSEKTAVTDKQWWKFTIVNIVLTMLLYPLFTQWGGANEPNTSKLSFMPLEMGNGIILWLVVRSSIIGIILF